MLLVHERAQLVEFGRRMRGDELTVGTSQHPVWRPGGDGYVNLKWPQGDGLKWPHVISS
jgi:hypothetical protein